MSLTKNEGLVFGYKTVTGRIVTQYIPNFEWDEARKEFRVKVTFKVLPGESIIKAGIRQFGRWFWHPSFFDAPKTIPRNKLGEIDVERLPIYEINYSWTGLSLDSEPAPKGYQAPHGPGEACTCLGCGACDGLEMDCTCDIDWEAMREAREDQWLENQFK